ncbi:hypothetical protein HW555_013598 [Spodoptera exigua]|uniref:Uncharacterized protein n=1 Tax=Spodoptera exigua TaxID=7107 RepID=A0A835KZN2_SPOEX|nr:hypothetical protein HW555_013598 [Spodoptera exigua]
MSSTEEALCYLGIISYYISKTKNNRRRRKVWVRNWLTKRERLSHVNLVRELREEKEDFQNYFRMPEPVYEELWCLVTPIIAKQDTCMREAISPRERLSATLRFLITGGTYKDVMYSSAISRQSLGYIIPETCDAIYSALKTYLKWRITVAHGDHEQACDTVSSTVIWRIHTCRRLMPPGLPPAFRPPCR